MRYSKYDFSCPARSSSRFSSFLTETKYLCGCDSGNVSFITLKLPRVPNTFIGFNPVCVNIAISASWIPIEATAGLLPFFAISSGSTNVLNDNSLNLTARRNFMGTSSSSFSSSSSLSQSLVLVFSTSDSDGKSY